MQLVECLHHYTAADTDWSGRPFPVERDEACMCELINCREAPSYSNNKSNTFNLLDITYKMALRRSRISAAARWVSVMVACLAARSLAQGPDFAATPGELVVANQGAGQLAQKEARRRRTT